MTGPDEMLECDDCGHPIDPDELEGITSFTCPNCGVSFAVDHGDESSDHEYEDSDDEEESDEDDEKEEEGDDEYYEEEDVDEEAEADEYEEEDEESDDDEKEEEVEEESDDDEKEEEVEEEEPEVDEYEEEEVEDEHEPEKNSDEEKSRKPRKDVFRHSQQSIEYLDFFLDHPEGVTISMLQEAFNLDVQSAHYAQRRTFKDAENLGYEIEKKRVDRSMKKMFFIRDVVGGR